ncbi:MAG: glutamate--tRNA ligase [Candidatus Yanofskybacteria bacterium RIFCSPHIGHO2_02_FULL_50_12]|uniref:Glutamate--tRNA ligase n=1 Tax=Candidatus Yanofskybacteria bacterium RIFCSPHIGHO2_02_FULL_50_12 TaxID=1802685 RepID=A0A1F8FUB5_9BACT|nr:MAG: glutamate--tRNA ligase [Candidatus Yanofskybacteria bacterium RIFCSPHIGHO2_02_FULL_50_12]
MSVKVRIAPSPTGFLHVGTGQSALYNWLFARKNGGTFQLRIEDTDRERSTKEYEQSIFDALAWLGLTPDGEISRQSEHAGQYRSALEELLAEGKAFYCRHTQEELEAERKNQESKKEPPRHLCDHKNSREEESGIIRLAVKEDDRIIKFDDIIRGPIEFQASLLGDFSIAKSLDEALYNFAVVMDDADMRITHVIRGEDHISNTPKQILIYEALGLPIPHFAHLPLILASDRSKLSKRHGAVAVVDYKKDYLPEALSNFLGSIGYTFSKEILTKEEMISEFDLSKVHKSGAVFDVKKLNWINAQYIRRLSASEFKGLTGLKVSDEAVLLITERLEKLSDASEFSYLWSEPEYPKELLLWKTSSSEEVKQSLEKSLKFLEPLEWGREAMVAGLGHLSNEAGGKGPVFWPLRVALSGKDKSPDPIDIALAIGKEETIKRVQKAVNQLDEQD